jgi:protein TonB
MVSNPARTALVVLTSIAFHAAALAMSLLLPGERETATSPTVQFNLGEEAVQVTVIPRGRQSDLEICDCPKAPPPQQRFSDSSNLRFSDDAATLANLQPAMQVNAIEPPQPPIVSQIISIEISPQSELPTQRMPESNVALNQHAAVDQAETAAPAKTDSATVEKDVRPSTDNEDRTLEGVETGIRVLDLPAPRYPSLSRRRGEEGLVVLRVEVLPDGSAGHIDILEDPGFSRLTDAAVAAVRDARFTPAIRDGRPVPDHVRIPFNFVLK